MLSSVIYYISKVLLSDKFAWRSAGTCVPFEELCASGNVQSEQLQVGLLVLNFIVPTLKFLES